jgi:hypothetical protein
LPDLPTVLTVPRSSKLLLIFGQAQAVGLFIKNLFFAAVNVLARVVMKDVANCDTHCELRSSGNQQTVERMRRLGQLQGASWSVFKSFCGPPSAARLPGLAALCAKASTRDPWRIKIGRLEPRDTAAVACTRRLVCSTCYAARVGSSFFFCGGHPPGRLPLPLNLI